ncbi:hypothetical protein ACH427_25890 [Streptomyces sp. NPDC020379]|uniref:hypothetical protein n=1 Tax=Streptomyces sp. NPDC020379 TaxID=3365071 RepID=UPI0037B588A3
MGVERMRRKRTVGRLAAAVAVAAAGLGPAVVPACAEERPRADYQAVAHPVVGRVGQTVQVELGVRNGGPGPAPVQGGHGTGTYEVIPPAGTTITAARPPQGGGRQPCVAKAAPAGPAAYVCAIGEDFPAGDLRTLSFQVRIDRKVAGAEGRVQVLDRDGEPVPDPDPANDSAPILVEILDPAPAPARLEDPGTNGTLLIATTSGTALSAGAIAVGVSRRRRR